MGVFTDKEQYAQKIISMLGSKRQESGLAEAEVREGDMDNA